ncbi:MAG: hypothetical protein ACHQ51_10840 [Elusimicrobiota bacterium]
MNEFAPMMRPSRKTLVLSLLGLTAFLAVEALLLRHYIRVDIRPPSWEQSVQMEMAMDYHDAKAAGAPAALKPGTPPYPPVYQWLLSGAYDSKDPPRAALWVNWGYMAFLALSLFGISWRFLPDSRALAATLAFCAAPGLQDLMTTQLVDLSIVALVSAGYWALLECDGFTYWIPSLLFGVVYAVGMLHKWSYLSYMIPAYVIGARALGDRNARLKVLAAAAVSAVIFLPWYWTHWTLIPAWLARGWATGGASFMTGGAWLRYLVLSAGEVGPPLWALGFISLLAPQYVRRRENGWILGYWVVCAYVFWTIVPDRQMRFLFPGLVPLGLAMAATWPGSVTWSVTAFQLVCALNFFFGLAGPFQIPTPLVPMTLLQNRPPARADWKIPEILARIEAAREPSRPVAPVAFLADDEYFNPQTFHWTQRWLKLPHALLRGVDAKRLTELSEFVLVKDGRMGPEDRIGDLPAAVKAMAAPDGWFQGAYEALERWPLPDGTAAVLYRQRRGRANPASVPRVSYTFFEAGQTQVRGLNVDLGSWDAGASDWGNVMLSADRIDMPQGLKIRGLTADLENFSVFPLYEGGRGDFAWSDMRLMRLDRAIVRSLQVDAADIQAFAEKSFPGLKLDSLVLDGTAKASGSWNGRSVAVEAAVELDRATQSLRVRVLSASYAGFAVPAALFKPVQELDYSLAATPERPFALELAGVTLRNGRLTVP